MAERMVAHSARTSWPSWTTRCFAAAAGCSDAPRLWLEILPGAGALIGGVITLASASSPVAIFGAWLAGLSGAWFALGDVIGQAGTGSGLSAGTPVGGTLARAVEQIGFFTGLGVAIAFLAALALGRFTVVGIREAAIPRVHLGSSRNLQAGPRGTLGQVIPTDAQASGPAGPAPRAAVFAPGRAWHFPRGSPHSRGSVPPGEGALSWP